jgi:hypothetical protein
MMTLSLRAHCKTPQQGVRIVFNISYIYQPFHPAVPLSTLLETACPECTHNPYLLFFTYSKLPIPQSLYHRPANYHSLSDLSL